MQIHIKILNWLLHTSIKNENKDTKPCYEIEISDAYFFCDKKKQDKRDFSPWARAVNISFGIFWIQSLNEFKAIIEAKAGYVLIQ